MDNLTHSLVGALLGQMGLKRKTGLAMPTLIIAANIPDIDAVATLLSGHQHLAIRRGITHGPPAMVILPLLLWAAMLAYAKWRPNEARLPIHKGWLLALAYIGTLSHPALDWLNVYGIRLLEPFSSQWFYGDTIFIIDVWIWAALISSVWISRRRERRGHGNYQRPAWIGFTAVCGYIFLNGAITGKAEADGLNMLRARHSPTATMPDPMVVASPVPVEFWRREMLWRDDENFGSGSYILGGGLTLDVKGHPHGVNRLLLSYAERQVVDGPAYLFWSRMPVFNSVGRAGFIYDQRFSSPLARGRFELDFSNQVPMVEDDSQLQQLAKEYDRRLKQTEKEASEKSSAE
jgi:inner membrane protein